VAINENFRCDTDTNRATGKGWRKTLREFCRLAAADQKRAVEVRGDSCSRVRGLAHRTRLLHGLEVHTKVPLVHAGPRNADVLGFRVLPKHQGAGKKGIIGVAPEENGLYGTRWH